MNINKINGVDFGKMLISAAAAVDNKKTVLNELNVFPVPDGDTGTNMALTLRAAAENLENMPISKNLSEVSAQISSSLLRGARGNSGVITSLLFRGMSKKFKGNTEADAELLAEAMKIGVESAYGAVMKPAEGTVLTVSRKAADAALIAAEKGKNIQETLTAAYKAALIALDETPSQNPVLAKAGVVDAGGKGYCYILEGFIASLTGESIVLETKVSEAGVFKAFDTDEILFTYCTEFIVIRNAEMKPAMLLRAYLESMGDSVVTVEDDDIIKIHVHTNNPGKVLEEALNFGVLTKIKIENMKEQHTEQVLNESELHEKKEKTVKKAAEKPYGFVSVTAGEGITAVFRDLGVDRTVEGGQTMNPSTDDILREIDKVDADTVFVLPNNKNIELAAQQTVALVDNKRVIVLSTHTIPQGISAMLAFDSSSSTENNIENMKAAIKNVRSAAITYAARNSVYGDLEISEGDILALCENKVCSVSKSMTEAINTALTSANAQQSEFITVFYGEDVSDDEANKVFRDIKTQCPNADVNLVSGGQPVYYYLISIE